MEFIVELAGDQYLPLPSEIYQWLVLDNGALEIRRHVEGGTVEKMPVMVVSPSGWRLVRRAQLGNGLVIHSKESWL